MTNGPRVAGRGARHRAVLAGVVPLAFLLLAAPLAGQMATADRLREPGWWPTKRTAPRADYVGTRSCLGCHPTLSTQLMTAMARTAQRAEDSPVLSRPEPLTFAVAHYTYSIAPSGGRIVYTVTDGERTMAAPLRWALGAGTVGQTYVFERGGSLHEARASYYAAVGRLDFTPGQRLEQPRHIEEAAARPMDNAEAQRCFGCHTTASSTAAGFDLETSIPGVTCEACHGPGRAHAEAAERFLVPPAGTIMNPARLDATDSVDFCGSCHATFWDVRLAGERGLAALRSQPHQIQSSPCWGEGDDRITCVACHDPHKPIVRDSSAYDANCLSCHQMTSGGERGRHDRAGRGSGASSPTAAPCPTGTMNCAGCHMPKYDVPGMHFAFTDHLIRIVR